MSNFYTTVSNTKGTIKGITGKNNGQSCHIRTWEYGVKVSGVRYDTQENKPIGFQIYQTGGSNGAGPEKYIGELITNAKGKLVFKRAKKWQG